MLAWTPAVAVGIPELDDQHRELFRRADAFVEALESSSAHDVARLLAFLREYAALHFAAEEAWMRRAGYPDVDAHRAEHLGFAAQLAAYGGGAAPAPGDVAAWLVRWLHDHVLRADGAAARFVHARLPDRG